MLLDVTHTSHTRARTGIQRVCRALAVELARLGPLTPICHDPHERAWRALDRTERETLAGAPGPAAGRGARWPLSRRILGPIRRLAGRRAPPPGDALLCPELFSARAAAHLPELFARVRGPRAAVFHDAIGLKYPELTPGATVARLPGYLRELAGFDGVAAVSEDSASSLREFWAWAGLRDTPPVVALPLGVDPVPPTTAAPAPGAPRVLCVATIEGRKNHGALLEAAERLWRDGLRFELELVGLPRPDTGARALERIRELQAAGRPLVHHGSVGDDALHAAYARSTFTVYPSLHEGFGLPVLESLRHGRPCICAPAGALAEVARDGGVALVARPDAAELAREMRRLLTGPDDLTRLAAAARGRRFRSWADYAADLRAWLAGLPRRS
jgi:glycosyltransferase involved in cell wall biosynthesis